MIGTGNETCSFLIAQKRTGLKLSMAFEQIEEKNQTMINLILRQQRHCAQRIHHHLGNNVMLYIILNFHSIYWLESPVWNMLSAIYTDSIKTYFE